MIAHGLTAIRRRMGGQQGGAGYSKAWLGGGPLRPGGVGVFRLTLLLGGVWVACCAAICRVLHTHDR
jgi:hypothetical protein